MANDTPVAVYEHDLREVLALLTRFRDVFDSSDSDFSAGTRVVLWSKNDYDLGALEYEEGQWVWVLPPSDRSAPR